MVRALLDGDSKLQQGDPTLIFTPITYDNDSCLHPERLEVYTLSTP